MTEHGGSAEKRCDDAPKRQFAHKLIVASTGPWVGELYLSRAGDRRFQFGSFGQFVELLPIAIGWDSTTPAPTRGCGDVRATSAQGLPELVPVSKFIIALESPWAGAAYRTRGTSRGKLRFESFGQLVSRAVEITGWPARTLPSALRRPGAGTPGVAVARLRAAL